MFTSVNLPVCSLVGIVVYGANGVIEVVNIIIIHLFPIVHKAGVSGNVKVNVIVQKRIVTSKHVTVKVNK